jgi:polygalacturonase
MIASVLDYGAVNDGRTLTTAAIQAAIDAVAKAGGGTVVLPPGIYRSGTIHLRSRLRLELEPGAVLQGSPELADYPPAGRSGIDNDRQEHHLLIARDCVHLRIGGGGTIDGNGPAFWEPSEGPRAWIRSKSRRVSPLLELSGCSDLVLEDITIRNSPGWTVHAFCCDRVRIRGVTVDNQMWGPNTDGFDLNGVRDLMMSDCHVTAGDDAIVLKTSRDARSCERVTITNCVLKTYCAALKLGTESWHDFRNIAIANCVVHGSPRAFACYMFDGATIEDVAVSNIACDTACGWALNRPLHLDLRRRDRSHPIGPDAPAAGRMRNIAISNLVARTDGRLILTAADGGRIEGVRLSGLSLRYPIIEDPAVIGTQADGLQFSRHSPEARGARAAIVADGVDGLRVDGLSIRWPVGSLDADWGDDIDNGLWTRPTRAELLRRMVEQPPFHVAWLRDCQGGLVDVAGTRANTPDLPAVYETGSNILCRGVA